MSTTSFVQHNRLIHEKSPYLLQHADNPVDWYAWGEEAFAKAKKEGKPIFLSIGYSTCHWCHVMEYESFEKREVADRINRYFVPIKVDREERPDIDHIYMAAVSAMTGQGGWPLTVFLTPDKKPFFGGTYFSAYGKWGRPGLMDILESIHTTWMDDRKKFLDSSESLVDMLQRKALGGKNAHKLDEDILKVAFIQLQNDYDRQSGGFGYAPKFPMGHNLSFLLRYWKRSSDSEALEIVEHTLSEMAQGGIYDHLGGGFHRYSTDHQWQVPHFEKMLYDQAMLSTVYLEAYQITKKEAYAKTAREIFDYVLRDMQDKDGGFYSAEDADSLDPDKYSNVNIDLSQKHKKEEGVFYVWNQAEIDVTLGKEVASIFNVHFGVKPSGNAIQDPHQEFTGKNIIYTAFSIEKTAKQFGKSVSEIEVILQQAKQKLFTQRQSRPRPHLDDKVLTDWNGLMIAALALGANVLDEPRYYQQAVKAADFILKHLIDQDGHLLHRYRDGESAIVGTLEDYAFFIYGLLNLYEATFDIQYLQQAVRLTDVMIEDFWDEKNGGFYLTADDAEKLLFRPKEIYDGAIPSGNAFAALNLVRLSRMTLQKKWEEKLEELFIAFSGQITVSPNAYAQTLIAFNFALGPTQEIVISVGKNTNNLKNFQQAIYEKFFPNKVILLNNSPLMKELAPFMENQVSIDGELTVYVCENHVCKCPVKTVEEFEELLK